MNKEGGAAWIVKVNTGSDATQITYDVKYILTSQREKYIPKDFITKDSPLDRTARPRRSLGCTPSTDEKTDEDPKRRRVSRSPLRPISSNIIIDPTVARLASAECSLDKSSSNLVLLATALDDDNKETLNSFAAKFNAVLTEDVTDKKITHLIVRTSHDGIIKQRTMKYMVSLMYGCWIVDVAWLNACLSSNKLVPEAEFEVYSEIKAYYNNQIYI
jgi:hypothetical protein